MEKRTLSYVALGLLVWAISGTLVAGYYLTQYNIYFTEYKNLADDLGTISKVLESISLRIGILISYNNGTKIWQNNTAIPLASTAFTAILATADIEYVDYGGDLGILVTSINGLANNDTHGWLYWCWDAENSVWVLPEYSSAKYILHRDDVIAFTYVSYATWPPPQPT